ncbi:PQQ-binding-like beta-propeller repeat protein [Winogradskyella vidalii]|uniref:PQQ-binding-like beta-propeller repeat protein n=1 Tax=Winogradskyella vidalii TaxID=2615024 RepID=UPI0015C83A61|nr:PQQ-binding-like beta-propeller repeat protein [Winogradskyella vidalii]
MKRLGLLSIFFTLVLACQKDYNKTKQAYKFIPSESTAIIQINELNDFISSIDNNEILSSLYNKELKDASQTLQHLNTTKEIYLAFTDSINSDYIILTENDSTLFVRDSIKNHISGTLTGSEIEKTQINDFTIYHKVLGNTFASSNNLELLKSLDSKNENTELSKLIETSDRKSVASILFKSNTTNYSKLLFTPVTNSDTLNYTILDLDYSDKGLKYNGILTSKDSSNNYLDSFKNTIPQKTNTPSIAPYNTKSLTSISYNDFSVFNKNSQQITDSTTTVSETFLNFTDEIAQLDMALVLHSLDPSLILEAIEDKSHIESFRAIDIFEFGTPDFFKSNLKPILSFENAKYFAVYENFTVFTNSIESLKSILTNALNNNTLAHTDAFKNINEGLSDEASLFIFKNSEGLSEILGKPMTGYNANAVQFIREDNYTHVNGVVQEFKKRAASNSVTETFTTPLETSLLTAPQAVKNHVTKAHDIVVQDVNNTLYLISSTGNILWKKQLQGKILGQVEQIDMYKNGRLQLAFTTPNRLYVLDRNGNNVSNFPLKFNHSITQPLSVFDYNKRKDYRLLITQGKYLLMYNTKGKSVNGFNYKNNNSEIITQPKHFRIGTKDYIVFGTGENLKILNRQGDIRIDVKDKINFSGNDIYLYQNKFSTSNTLGQLFQVDTKGKISKENLNLTENHKISTTSKTLVSLRENRLKIKSRIIDLDYGDYTAPRIFYLNDKIYVSTTDKQAKKVYLFDSQANPIPNFPVFGTARATLEKLDNDNSLELITQSDDKTIIVYKLH